MLSVTDAPLVGHFQNFHPSEMFSPGRERNFELSLRLTCSLLPPVSCWPAGIYPAPSPCPGQPGSCGAWSAWMGSAPQGLTRFTCGFSLSLTGNTQFRGRRPHRWRVRSLSDLTPDWEATVGSEGDTHVHGDGGQLSGTWHRARSGRGRPRRWLRGLTGGSCLGQKQQVGGLGRVHWHLCFHLHN